MSDFEQAKRQLAEMIDYLRKNQSADCTEAEKEDEELIRLTLQQRILTPTDAVTIGRIDRYYKKFFDGR